MKKGKVSYGFYKPHPLAMIALIGSIIVSVIVWLPSNFTAKVGDYSRLFYVQWIVILIVAIGTVILFYVMSRTGAEKEIIELKSETGREGEK
jgi:glucan phosphoethanolaminetransferase (alkaline phosphatase superfamily)